MVKETLRSEAPSRDERFATVVRELIQAVKFLLNAQDMDRAVAFYRDVIGLDLKETSPHWSELTYGDAIIALHGGGTGELQRTGLSFQVEDIHAVCQAVVVGGGKILLPPQDRPGEPIILAEVVDTEGNGFMLSQNKETEEG